MVVRVARAGDHQGAHARRSARRADQRPTSAPPADPSSRPSLAARYQHVGTVSPAGTRRPTPSPGEFVAELRRSWRTWTSTVRSSPYQVGAPHAVEQLLAAQRRPWFGRRRRSRSNSLVASATGWPDADLAAADVDHESVADGRTRRSPTAARHRPRRRIALTRATTSRARTAW